MPRRENSAGRTGFAINSPPQVWKRAGIFTFPAKPGVTYVLKAADQFEIVAQNDLGAPILASPAALAGRLYLRAGRTLYCIGK